MTRTLLLSAADPYQDPWHGLRRTSTRLSAVLDECGADITLVESVAEAISEMPDAELLVVNLAGAQAEDPLAAELDTAIAAHVGAGRPILAMHASVIALRALPAWVAAVGGAWRSGQSMHPQIGFHVSHVFPHPAADGLDAIRPYDERYSFLEIDSESRPIVGHVHDGVEHVLAWSRSHSSGARAVVNTLGHGAESYADHGHRRLLHGMYRWLTESPERTSR